MRLTAVGKETVEAGDEPVSFEGDQLGPLRARDRAALASHLRALLVPFRYRENG